MARRRKPPVHVEVPGRPDPLPPWKHQAEGTAKAVEVRRLMMHADMRTGKTRITIDAVEKIDARRVLIVGPKIVVDVWATQYAEWATKPWRLVLLDERAGSGKQKAAAVRDAMKRYPGERIAVVVNFESAWRKPLADALDAFDPDAVVFDECHKLKSPGGKSSLWAREIASERREMVLGLTGTPMPAGPLDLYSQFRAISPGLLGRSFTRFRARYAQLSPRAGYVKVTGYRNQRELAERIAPATHRIRKDVLDLVPTTHQQVRVQLSPAGARAYSEMETFLRAQVDGGEVTAKNGMVMLLRLQQITGGVVPTDDGGLSRVDTAKSEALQELLESLDPDEPAVVIGRFIADLDEVHRVAANLGRGSRELSGRRRELDEWKRGAAPILAVQIQAGGIGIDLTRASYCCFYSTGFSLGDFEQAVARIHGPDQKRHAHYHYLVAANTVDEAVYGSLRQKRNVAEDIIEGYLKTQRRQTA